MDRRVSIVRGLVECCSIRSLTRMTGHSKNTIARWLFLSWEHCDELLRDTFRHVDVRSLQLDEIWTFNRVKEQTIRKKVKAGKGDKGRYFDCGSFYLYTALEQPSKAIIAHRLGRRDGTNTMAFMDRVAGAVNGSERIEMASDAFAPYISAIQAKLGVHRTAYTRITKYFVKTEPARDRYTPPWVLKAERNYLWGNPERKYATTSHVERINLSIRMEMKRFARLTLCFSKSVRHLQAAINLWMAYYNLCSTHRGVNGRTPAMALGITSETWSLEMLIPN
ncbi:MAG: hypothetical protein LN413_00230 [Candidatus Thermoplasmatota archaeon]|nr:hypothetical protein [Candidatus Thermoplasmatota archaeon]